MKKLELTFPIYYTQEFKTKKPKVWLIGLNNYRNWHYMLSNQVKLHVHSLVKKQVGRKKIKTPATFHYKIYAKRRGTDGPNIRSVMEKFISDGLVECGAMENDSIEHITEDTSKYFIDKTNPRIEVVIVYRA